MVRNDVALVGGLTLSGELVPVSGFKAKVAAAKGGYARRLVAPAGNEPDLSQIPERQRQEVEFVFASTLDEALRGALARHPAKGFLPPA